MSLFYSTVLILFSSNLSSAASVEWAELLKTKKCAEVMKPTTFARGAQGLNSKFETGFEGCAFFYETPSSRFSNLEKLMELDTCVSGETSWRHSGLEEKEGGANLSTETANSAEREKIKTQFLTLRMRAAEVCCQADAECSAVVQKTKLSWCDVPVDENSKAPCREGGVFTNQTAESWEHWQKQRKKLEDLLQQGALPSAYASTSKKIDLPIFEIFLSQRIHSQTRTPLSSARVIAHELGHVCVNTKRFQAVRSSDRQKSQAAFSLSNDLGWPRTREGLSPRCTPTVAHEKTWQALGSSFGLNKASMKCLEKLAALAPIPRFVTSLPLVCKPICRNDIWDESLADAIHFDILPKSEWIPSLFPNYCTYRRDGSHALAADQLSCYLLTPQFKKKIEAGLGCRPLISGPGNLIQR